MSTPPLSIEDFKTELSNRYIAPVTELRSRTELIHLLDQRQVFLNASIFRELIDRHRYRAPSRGPFPLQAILGHNSPR